MKKVRFESPVKMLKINVMNDSECHSPRPFVEKQIQSTPPVNYLEYRTLPFTNDPVQRFECSDSSPYPIVNKTYLSRLSNLKNNSCSPSNELDLSILDYNYNDSRNMRSKHNSVQSNEMETLQLKSNIKNPTSVNQPSRMLTSIENRNSIQPPNILSKDDDFFLRKDNLNDVRKIHSQFNALHLEKENNPLLKKTEIMQLGIPNVQKIDIESSKSSKSINGKNPICQCHHCVHVFNAQHNIKQLVNDMAHEQNNTEINYKVCHCSASSNKRFSESCYPCPSVNHFVPFCNCSKPSTAYTPQNGVDKKNWIIEKYDQSKKSVCLDVETPDNILKEKREPTVGDLFKIIKLQNEQLQLLQEKVDKFISANKPYEPQKNSQPIQNYVEKCLEVKTIGTEEKISIGVMTSFEMFRTSTIINKEIVKKSEAQIQCNRSQINIKEVSSNKSPVNLNFLEGITPNSNQVGLKTTESCNQDVHDLTKMTENALVDKTLNEMSLYNVQVDNAITPLMSPEQSLYLDVRDYSDSDSSDDPSNVGWTYYNKVMTHVNGILQDSDMPSSASALYRNGKQKCLQVQIDKTNVSVAKRVTFGDDPFGLPEQPHLRTPTTDTSLKMNQLAAKYLKSTPQMSRTPSPKPQNVQVDMSLATRNYMEKHNIIRGTNHQNKYPQVEIPKFLDITALKQQPKFL